MLNRLPIPGFFITGTDTGVGKTLIAGAIANWFVRQKKRVGVCKPCATGCEHRREGLVSPDAEFLAVHANSPFPLDMICPQRYGEPLAPAIAAERAGQPIDWPTIDRALQEIAGASEVMIVEGVGGLLVPMDRKTSVLDMIQWLNLPTIIVARPALGTINHTLLTARILREAGVNIAGVVINQYPAEMPGEAEETNPRAIERWGKIPVLCLVPKVNESLIPQLPADVIAAIDTVDWNAKLTAEK